MSNEVIVAVTDNTYLNHIYSLFGNLERVGNWKGDFAVILSEEIPLTEYQRLYERNIHVFNCCKNKGEPFFAKFYVFSEFMKNWKRVCYFDADFLILKDINQLFKQNGNFLVDFEEFWFWQYLTPDANMDEWVELKKNFNVEVKGFNTSCMLFDPKIIETDTIFKLFDLKNKYSTINRHTGLPTGTDQPIINILFFDKVSQISGVDYFGRVNPNTIASHTCRWSASWNQNSPFLNYYNDGLKYFLYDMNK